MRMFLAAAVLVAAAHGYTAPRLAPQAVAERLAKGEAIVLVDTRARAAYDREHLVGAVSAPISSLDHSTLGLPKDKLLVLYCTCPAEHGALAAAAKLHDRYGYAKLSVLEGGLDAWREAGYQVAATTPKPSAKPSPKPTVKPSPAPSATPMTAPEQRDPMDEQRGTNQSP